MKKSTLNRARRLSDLTNGAATHHPPEPPAADSANRSSIEEVAPGAIHPTRNDTPHEEIPVESLMLNSRFEDIARRILMHQTPAEIAASQGISKTQLNRILRDPRMVAVFTAARDKLYDDLDSTLKNEKAAPMLRARAQTIRAQTMLAEIMEEIRDRISTGMAKSSELRVGVDLGFGLIDRGKTELDDSQQTKPIDQITLNEGTSQIVADSLRESGVDLSDVLSSTEPPATLTESSEIEPDQAESKEASS